MTPKHIQEIKERLEKATPGPWTIKPRNLCFYNKDDSMKEFTNELCLAEETQNGDFLGASVVGPIEPGRSDFVVRDAWFIANARTDIEKLLKEREIFVRAMDEIKSRDTCDCDFYTMPADCPHDGRNIEILDRAQQESMEVWKNTNPHNRNEEMG